MKDYLQFMHRVFGSLLEFFPHRPDNRLLVGKAASDFGSWTHHPEPEDLEVKQYHFELTQERLEYWSLKV